MSKYFADTCVVAEKEEDIVGFASAFMQPQAADTIFLWQIAVDESQRGEGLAGDLLKEIIKRDECQHVRFLETTITPSNEASQALFTKLADELDTRIQVVNSFSKKLFPDDDQEVERLYRIGPFMPQTIKGGH